MTELMIKLTQSFGRLWFAQPLSCLYQAMQTLKTFPIA